MLEKAKSLWQVFKIRFKQVPKKFLIIGGIVLLVILLLVFKKGKQDETAVAERGDVTRSVLVYGQLEHEQEARIGFATGGRISRIGGAVGDKVYKGQLLLQVEAGSELAQLASSNASYIEEQAEAAILKSKLSFEKESFETTIKNYRDSVDAARNVLFSSGLRVTPLRQSDFDITAPSVSGTYNSDEKGAYNITIYASASDSGYSFRYFGLETGTGQVSFVNPVPLGKRGLLISFTDGVNYSNTRWEIEVPNTGGSSYPQNLASYVEAVKARDAAIQSAKEDLESTTIKEGGTASVSNARVQIAAASRSSASAQLMQKTITAPFSGTLALIDAAIGEFAEAGKSIVAVISGEPVIVKVQIPQVDIVEVKEGMLATVSLEQTEKTYNAVVTHIDKVEQEVDGVPTYGATITITEPDEFLRSGMEVSAEIVTDKRVGVLRIPLDSLYTDTTAVTLVHNNKKDKKPTNVQVGMRGTDGFVEVIGLAEGDVVLRNVGESKKVAPEVKK